MTDPLSPGPTPAPAPPAGGVKRLIGGFLMVLGILWMLLCGACTALATFGSVPALLSGSGSGQDAVGGGVALVLTFIAIGVGSALPGIAMFFIGRALRRP
jgi:hypothetical protein